MGFKNGAIRYLKFSLSSILGTITDTVVLWLVSTFWLAPSHLMQYVVAPCISFECSVVVNYTMGFFFVWKERIGIKTIGSYLGHLWIYNLSCVAAFLVKMLFLNLIALIFKFDTVICNLIALCFSGVLNFFLNDLVTFRRRRTPSEEISEVDN